MQSNLELLPLKELTTHYCRVRGLVIDQNTSRASNRRWDFVIQNGADNEGIGITIKDWKRAVGVDIIIAGGDIPDLATSRQNLLKSLKIQQGKNKP